MVFVNANGIFVIKMQITLITPQSHLEATVESPRPFIDRLIRIHEVIYICGLSRSFIYASIQKGEFPSQVKLSKKASAWVYSEVLAWATARAGLRKMADSARKI